MERLILVEYALLWHMHITSLAVSRSPSNSWQVVHTYIVLNRNKHITLLLPITIGSFYLYNLTPEPAFHSTSSATSHNELSKSIRVSEDGERRVESSRFDWCRDSWRQVINQSSTSLWHQKKKLTTDRLYSDNGSDVVAAFNVDDAFFLSRSLAY